MKDNHRAIATLVLAQPNAAALPHLVDLMAQTLRHNSAHVTTFSDTDGRHATVSTSQIDVTLRDIGNPKLSLLRIEVQGKDPDARQHQHSKLARLILPTLEPLGARHIYWGYTQTRLPASGFAKALGPVCLIANSAPGPKEPSPVRPKRIRAGDVHHDAHVRQYRQHVLKAKRMHRPKQTLPLVPPPPTVAAMSLWARLGTLRHARLASEREIAAFLLGLSGLVAIVQASALF